MSTLQHDEAMIQALAITKAQAGVRSMSAEEIVTYINDLVRAIRSTLDKNMEDDGQAEEKVDTEGLDPRKSIRENSVTCLECGQKFKMITKRHLRIHNLTPEEYKEKWGFRKNSSLACKSLQRMRRQKMKDMHIWDLEGSGGHAHINVTLGRTITDADCTYCGQCIINCSTGALRERDDTEDVYSALADPSKIVVAQVAPAVRAGWGEDFGLNNSEASEGRLVTALKKLGFDYVFDTNMGADMTIMEEAAEFLQRMQNPDHYEKPMFTSCSPGWVRYMEYEYPQLLDHLSTCKSPHMMFGAICKTYWAKQHNIDPSRIYVVSIMPCIAKKSEIHKEENQTGDYPDVDAVLTTREAARLIKMYGMDDLDALQEEDYDQDFLGTASGAGVIFGAGGGVMEAALRTLKQETEGKKLERVDFGECRGMAGVKEAQVELLGKKYWVAMASSMSCAKPLIEDVRTGTSKYAFIEIMGCPGGCINGGGQPIVSARAKHGRLGYSYKDLRMKALYEEDRYAPVRVSCDNPQIQQLYSAFLGKPGSEISEHLLHTSYHRRPRFTGWKTEPEEQL